MSVAVRWRLFLTWRHPMPRAERKRSGGRPPAAAIVGRHQKRTAMTPSVLMALSQNGAARPERPITMPASAGPIARLMLMPTLLSEIAACRSSRGTSVGTMACQAGAMSADPAPTRNVKISRIHGVTASNQTRTPSAATISVRAAFTAMSSQRRSTMSARAPAGRPSSTTGSIVATCTSETMKASCVRPAMSQPAAAFCIHVPMFETTVAIHRAAKTGCLRGASAEPSV